MSASIAQLLSCATFICQTNSKNLNWFLEIVEGWGICKRVM